MEKMKTSLYLQHNWVALFLSPLGPDLVCCSSSLPSVFLIRLIIEFMFLSFSHLRIAVPFPVIRIQSSMIIQSLESVWRDRLC